LKLVPKGVCDIFVEARHIWTHIGVATRRTKEGKEAALRPKIRIVGCGCGYDFELVGIAGIGMSASADRLSVLKVTTRESPNRHAIGIVVCFESFRTFARSEVRGDRRIVGPVQQTRVNAVVLSHAYK
jgi:hypothetical protein